MNPDLRPSCEQGVWNETEILSVRLWIIPDVVKNIVCDINYCPLFNVPVLRDK